MIHDVQEYVQQTVPPPQFYINDLLPQGGALLLYGAPGVMKSWMALGMGYSIATGTEWINTFQTVQTRVLIENFEISPASYHNLRLVPMSHRYTLEPRMFYEESPGIQYIDDPIVFSDFQNRVNQVDPSVLILDCLAGCFGGDENSSEKMAGFIRQLALLQDNRRRSIIIVHHSNKNLLATNAIDRSRGHTRLTGWVDSILYMVEQPTGVQIQFGKTRHSTRPLHAINVNFSNYVWTPRLATQTAQIVTH